MKMSFMLNDSYKYMKFLHEIIEMTALAIVDWGVYLDRLALAAEKDQESKSQQWAGARRKNEVPKGRSANLAPAGDLRTASIFRVLNMFEGFPRSEAQKQFHTAFTRACLPHIYGTADMERYREKILRDHSLEKIQYEILVCTPRRFGKTTSVSMWCAAMLACVPDMWISVFSTGQRASTSLLDQTAKFFRMLEFSETCRGGDSMILKKNHEQLWTKGTRPDDIRRMFSYPSSVGGLKGVGGKVLLLEEASRIDENVFKEVILPLTAVADTVLIGISTPLDDSNFYSQMLEMTRPDGSPLFNQLLIKTICDECLQAGLLSCPHINALPAWKSGERQVSMVSTEGLSNVHLEERFPPLVVSPL
jgi:hypothetical protein